MTESQPQAPQPGDLPEVDLQGLEDMLGKGLENVFSSPRLSAAAGPVRHRCVLEIGPGLDPPLVEPLTLAIDSEGRILVLDRPSAAEFRISRFAADGTPETTLAMIARDQTDEGLLDPAGLAVDKAFRMYIPDAQAGTVSRFSSDGRWLETFHSAGVDGGLFDNPRDVDVDEQGGLYVADTYNNRIVRLRPDGGLEWVLETFANPFENKPDDELYEPLSVCVGRGGTFYVADTNQNRLLAFDAQRRLVACLGEDGRFEFPSEVRLSHDGEALYIADQGNLRVQRFTRDGRRTGTLVLCRDTDSGGGGGDIDVNAQGHVVMVNPVRQSVVVLDFVEEPMQ